MKNFLLLLSAAICLTVSSLELTTSVLGQEAENQDSELQLEKLFPPTSMFGPSASRMAFSADGRYGAYLYRDYSNRRHGRDLWIHDFKTDKTTQITNIEMLAEFQRSSRLVIEDRKKKSRKDSSQNKSKAKGDDDKDEKEDETESEAEENNKEIAKASDEDAKSDEQVSLEVSEKDGKDYYAPAYSGISSFRWHPEENALLISSENDLYWMEDITKPNLVRLTKTDQRESSYSFTPDGDGITYQAGDTVFQLNFGEHFVGQINPKIPSGDSLGGYEITEDGSRMALICYSGSRASSSRTVDIIRYRDRFAKSDKISRTVSDDEVPERKVKIYMVSLDEGEFEFESAPLIKIFEETIDEPRDVISNPKWSLDGNHITFGFFNQEDSEVDIRMATWPTDEELKKATEKAVSKREKKEAEQAAENKKKDEKDRTPGRRGNSGGRTKAPELLEHDSKIVYQYKHYGGPNTPRQLAPNFDAKNHIVFVSEQSGYRHIHSLDPLYENLRQLTSGRFEVYPIRMSKDRKTLFVTSTKQTAARQMVYALDLESGEFTRLNSEDGNFSSVAVSDDGKNLLANFVTYGQLTELVAQSSDGEMKTLTDSHPNEAKELTKIEPEFFEYKNRLGHSISGMMFTPPNWKKSQKRPLLIYVYGGPLGTRHSVVDGSYSSDGYFFQMYMAQKHGYVTIVVDPRGQSGYGGLFEKSNYEQVGKPQVDDLVDAVKHMSENYNIDEEKVAIYGWSFGGFQTQMCLYTEPDVFKVGMAGAGPTQWENYNSWYTTGTVGPSRKGKPDQEKYSLIPLAKNLQGKLLLVHGIEDTNVLFQDTVAVYRALLQAGKETHVELFLDPTGGHGLGGDVKRIGRMRKYEEFLLRTIGSAEPKKAKKKKSKKKDL